MNIVLINGAPRSGKDSAGRMIAREAPGLWVEMKFSAIMKWRCHMALGIVDATGAPEEHDAFEDVKDIPDPRFHGVSPRQAYIAFSEKFMKPLYGKQVFGEMLGESICDLWHDDPLDGIVITDSGFREEAEVLVNRFAHNAFVSDKIVEGKVVNNLVYQKACNFTLLRLHRPGYNFDNDSRGLIDLTDLGVKTIDVNSPDEDLPGLFGCIKKAAPYLFRRKS